jgi:uncharacterized protein (PEP-CTERM system associated)
MALSPRHLSLYMASLLGLAAPGVSHARVDINAGVTPRIIYTDNLCLSADNEKSDLYGEITPYVGVTDSGRRFNYRLSASIDANTLSTSDIEDKCGGGNRNRDNFFPRLNASASAILVEQWLFLDSDVTASQNEVSPFVAGGDDRADRTGNTNTTYRYSVSPYISRRFKDSANLLLRYTFDDQYNSKDIVGDSSQERWQAILSSGPSFSPLIWSLQGDYRKTEYADTPGRPTNSDSELKSAQVNLGYQLNRLWQVNGFYGQEWNDFVSSRDEIDGDYWGAGLTWTPNSRTLVEVGTGDRFFGNTPWLRASHRHKRSEFFLDYGKTLTYSRDIRILDNGDDLGEPGNLTSLTNSPILDERLTLGYRYAGRRVSIGVDASYSDQTREGGSDRDEPTLELRESTFKDISLLLGYNLLSNLSLSGRVSWGEQEPKGDTSQLVSSSETWRVNFGATHSLSQNISLSLDYQYTDRQSDSSLNAYQENRITLSARINLL